MNDIDNGNDEKKKQKGRQVGYKKPRGSKKNKK
jgi:hypothetical protein